MSNADFPPSKSINPAEKLRSAGVDTEPEHEIEIWSGTYGTKAVLGQAVGVVLLSVLLLIAVVAIGALRGNLYAWLGLAAVLAILWLGLLGFLYYNKWCRYYELTTQRFKHRSGILTRVSDRIELIDIDDVRVRQGPIQALVGVGNITLTSSDSTHPEFVLMGIENAREIADLIDDARRAERRKRGLHIEAI